MLKPSYTRQFEKDLRRVQKRGKNVQKIRLIMSKLIEEAVLEEKHRDHTLSGNYKGRRECHIETGLVIDL